MYEVHIIDNYYSETLEQWFSHKSKIGEFTTMEEARVFVSLRRSYLEYGDTLLYDIIHRAP